MVRAFIDPDSCAAIETSNLPYSDCYHYTTGDALNLPVHVIGRLVWVNLSGGCRKSGKKLFQRAVVLRQEEEGRIMVEYPSGSTYKVRPSLLEGILSKDLCRGDDCTLLPSHNVLVYRETDAYRRACVIHCGPDEEFCEIGCAEGMACEKIRQTGNPQRIPMGLDKSPTCIDEANRRFPQCKFVLADIFQENFDWNAVVMTAPPMVIAIDINGTRELEAVLSSVERVIRHWKPRLVLVKSRAFYHAVNNNNNKIDEKD